MSCGDQPYSCAPRPQTNHVIFRVSFSGTKRSATANGVSRARPAEGREAEWTDSRFHLYRSAIGLVMLTVGLWASNTTDSVENFLYNMFTAVVDLFTKFWFIEIATKMRQKYTPWFVAKFSTILLICNTTQALDVNQRIISIRRWGEPKPIQKKGTYFYCEMARALAV